MSDIEWGAPPPSVSNRGNLIAFVDALRGRPNEWAKYPTALSRTQALSSYRSRFPGTEWTSRRRDDGKVDVYARWIGGAA